MSKSFEMAGVVEGIPEEFLRAAMTTQINELYEFGACRLDVQRRVLMRDGHAVPLAPKTFDLLLLLVPSQGRALSKQELMTALWPDVFVEEANLSFQISALRKALGDGTSQCLETIPKHGYRFTAPVKAVPAKNDDVAQSSTPVVAEVAPVARPAYRRLWIPGILVLLAIVIALSAALLKRSTALVKSAAPVPVAVPLTTDPGYETMPSFSPDGSQVAFAWKKESKPDYDIYVKLVGPGEPIQLTDGPSHDLNPAWSPDGRLIAFERCTTTGTTDLYVIPALGRAAEQRIATRQAGCGTFRSIAWTPDGEWLAWAGGAGPGIWLFDIHSLEKRQLTVDGWIPVFSEDGRRMAYSRSAGPGPAVHVLPLTAELTAAGPPMRVTPWVSMIRSIAWTPRGDALVYSASGWLGVSRLYRVALAANRLEPAGSPQMLPFGENGDVFSLSKTGSLVYSAFLHDDALMRLDLTELNRAPVPVADSTYNEYTPDYSPDGRIAFTSTRTGDEEIWIADTDGSKPVRMTTMNGPMCSNPRWSPSGLKILFQSTGSATGRALYVLDVTTRVVGPLTDGPNADFQASWSKDGQTIYFLSMSPSGGPEIWKMPAGGGRRVQVTRHGGWFGVESFDSRLLYYAKPIGPDLAIWRVPVDGGEEVAVTGVGLTDSLNFAVAQKGLYFVSGSSTVVGLLGDTPLGKDRIDFVDFKTGRRRTILELGKRSSFGIAVSPDERYLLYSVTNSVSRNLMLVDRIE